MNTISVNVENPYSMEYGMSLYNYVIKHKPKVIVEFGCSWGFTTIYMAKALQENGGGKIWTCDNLPSRIPKAKTNFKIYGVSDLIDIHLIDYNEWFKKPYEFDLCYIDIHNDGSKLQNIFENKFFESQIKEGKKVLFEGGSSVRSDVAVSRGMTSFDNIKYKYKLLFGSESDRSVIGELDV